MPSSSSFEPSSNSYEELQRQLIDLVKRKFVRDKANPAQVLDELLRYPAAKPPAKSSANGPIHPFNNTYPDEFAIVQKNGLTKPPAKQKKLDVDEIAAVIRDARDKWCSENGEWDPGKMPVSKLAAYIAKHYTVLGEGE